MNTGKRLYWGVALVALLALAGAALTLTSQFTSADDATPTAAGQNCDEQDDADAAAQSAASGPVGEVDLEHVDGRLVFNVDIGDKDVKVDASDGSIVSADSDG